MEVLNNWLYPKIDVFQRRLQPHDEMQPKSHNIIKSPEGKNIVDPLQSMSAKNQTSHEIHNSSIFDINKSDYLTTRSQQQASFLELRTNLSQKSQNNYSNGTPDVKLGGIQDAFNGEINHARIMEAKGPVTASFTYRDDGLIALDISGLDYIPVPNNFYPNNYTPTMMTQNGNCEDAYSFHNTNQIVFPFEALLYQLTVRPLSMCIMPIFAIGKGFVPTVQFDPTNKNRILINATYIADAFKNGTTFTFQDSLAQVMFAQNYFQISGSNLNFTVPKVSLPYNANFFQQKISLDKPPAGSHIGIISCNYFYTKNSQEVIDLPFNLQNAILINFFHDDFEGADAVYNNIITNTEIRMSLLGGISKEIRIGAVDGVDRNLTYYMNFKLSIFVSVGGGTSEFNIQTIGNLTLRIIHIPKGQNCRIFLCNWNLTAASQLIPQTQVFELFPVELLGSNMGGDSGAILIANYIGIATAIAVLLAGVLAAVLIILRKNQKKSEEQQDPIMTSDIIADTSADYIPIVRFMPGETVQYQQLPSVHHSFVWNPNASTVIEYKYPNLSAILKEMKPNDEVKPKMIDSKRYAYTFSNIESPSQFTYRASPSRYIKKTAKTNDLRRSSIKIVKEVKTEPIPEIPQFSQFVDDNDKLQDNIAEKSNPYVKPQLKSEETADESPQPGDFGLHPVQINHIITTENLSQTTIESKDICSHEELIKVMMNNEKITDEPK